MSEPIHPGPIEVAETTYSAYRDWVLTSSADRTPLPDWSQLPSDVQSSWVAQSLGIRQPRRPDPVAVEKRAHPIASLQRPLRESKEYVYFIRAKTGHIKIGVSGIPALRLAALQTASPVPLELVGVFGSRNARKAEAGLHRRFASQRCRGEWFEPNEKLLALIASLKPVTSRNAVKKIN